MSKDEEGAERIEEHGGIAVFLLAYCVHRTVGKGENSVRRRPAAKLGRAACTIIQTGTELHNVMRWRCTDSACRLVSENRTAQASCPTISWLSSLRRGSNRKGGSNLMS